MKYYKIRLKPKTSFGSPPMSDTIFGQLVWTMARMGIDIDRELSHYMKNPFLVVSDFFVNDLGLSPKLPVKYSVGESKIEKLELLLNRKLEKKKGFINISKLIHSKKLNHGTIRDISESLPSGKYAIDQVVRCSINRTTGTTGENFSPYAVKEIFYGDCEFSFYFYCRDELKNTVVEAMEIMGTIGFGKDATVGKGKFDLINNSLEEINLDKGNTNAVYTLSNCYLYKIGCDKAYYETFTRFGKHGDILATTGYPFKNPVVLARQGAVLKFSNGNFPSNPFVGTGINRISYHQKTVMQGYSLYIPIVLEEEL